MLYLSDIPALAAVDAAAEEALSIIDALFDDGWVINNSFPDQPKHPAGGGHENDATWRMELKASCAIGRALLPQQVRGAQEHPVGIDAGVMGQEPSVVWLWEVFSYAANAAYENGLEQRGLLPDTEGRRAATAARAVRDYARAVDFVVSRGVRPASGHDAALKELRRVGVLA